jgi:hypothetical protein
VSLFVLLSCSLSLSFIFYLFVLTKTVPAFGEAELKSDHETWVCLFFCLSLSLFRYVLLLGLSVFLSICSNQDLRRDPRKSSTSVVPSATGHSVWLQTFYYNGNHLMWSLIMLSLA